LAQAVDGLPDPLREVFVACEIEDLPGAEVARVLGVPEGTLWRRLHDARKAIRTAMGGLDP
jgi:RNA polymerase sigma-70 factor (ECF subfamily)